jgi:hypothetical protein
MSLRSETVYTARINARNAFQVSERESHTPTLPNTVVERPVELTEPAQLQYDPVASTAARQPNQGISMTPEAVTMADEARRMIEGVHGDV